LHRSNRQSGGADLFVAAAGTSPDLDITAVIRPYRADEKTDR